MVNPRRSQQRASSSSSSESSVSSSDVSSHSSGSSPRAVAMAASQPKGPSDTQPAPTSPRAWRLVDVEETCHFFNTEMVVSTNDILEFDAEGALAPSHANMTNGVRQHESEPESSVHSTLTTARDPAQTLYEDIFDDFDDLYLPGIAQETPSKLQRRRATQCEEAAQVLKSFCKDLHVGQTYLYRKRSEFLRVCFRRALERHKELDVKEMAETATKPSQGALPIGQRAFHFQCSRLERPIDVSIPELHPRKWPHLPYRDPVEWAQNPEAALMFAKRVSELPEGSLLYEPIDVDKFAASWCCVMEAEGVDVWTLNPAHIGELTETAVAALVAMLAFSIRLQSFSLLQLVAEVASRFGKSTSLAKFPLNHDNVQIVQDNLKTLQAFATTPMPPATYPRALISQWKLCSYQPSSSDAIATDGFFLYIYGRSGLLKVGTGRGSTLRDFVYEQNKNYCRSRDAERSWLCLIGEYLYCRSISTPSNRVDRICSSNLQVVDELFFSPAQQIADRPVGSSTVYALVSDGVDLFTINSYDSQKTAVKKKSRPTRSRKSTSNERTKTDAAKPSNETASSDVRVGDRVVRGPDWKWGAQDGEKGCPGTVERISTWGGVKGCGVTVRWDKNQRINTYRWGAEGCYDVVAVVEKSGGRLEKKLLPAVSNSGRVLTEPIAPRHHFIVTRYCVSSLRCVIDLNVHERESFLGSSVKSTAPTPKSAEDKELLLTAVHEHTLAVTSATTAWMCDGGTSGCLGDNSGVRYRCEAGCDFDLCDVCLTATLIEKQAEVVRRTMSTATPDAEHSDWCADQVQVSADAGDTASTQEDDFRLSATPDLTPEELDSARLSELEEFWCGLFTRKECEFALQRAEHSFDDAVQWLSECGNELKRPVLLTSIESFALETPPNSSGLDPVLLVAGSFYTVDSNLCIVSPPGLFQSERSKRSIHAADTAWFFSLTNGSLSFTKHSPVLLKSVPAGSPVCVDRARRRILVFSGYLNCVEEYAISKVAGRADIDDCSLHSRSLSQVGDRVYALLHSVGEQRWAHRSYKRARQGLQDWITQIHQSAAPISGFVRENSSADASSAKNRARRIKKLRLRLEEFAKLGHTQDRGYVVPYCADFSDLGLRALVVALHRALRNVKEMNEDALHNLHHLLTIWRGFLGDCIASDVDLHPLEQWSELLKNVMTVLLDVAVGKSISWSIDLTTLKLQSQIVMAIQDILLWGVDLGLLEGYDRYDLLIKVLEELLTGSCDLPPARYHSLMHDWGDAVELQSRSDCCTLFARRALAMNTESSEGGISSLLSVRCQAEELAKLLFRLSIREFVAYEIDRKEDYFRPYAFSPVDKALLALFNGCAVDLMINTEANLSISSPQRRRSSAEVDETLFQSFAGLCFQTCDELAKMVGLGRDDEGESVEDSLSQSICGKLLPLVLAMMCNCSRAISNLLEESTLRLTRLLSAKSTNRGSQELSEFMPLSKVVESSHPYNRNQPAVRKVVRIPGASCLHIQFDPRCSTSGEADFVFVTPGHAWFHSDRVPFGENGIGDAGGCFFGTSRGGNWPHRGTGISIWGDTATIMLCASSQERDKSGIEDEDRRWGLRCTIRGVHLPAPASWRNEIIFAAELALCAQSQRQLAHCDRALERPLILKAEPLIRTARFWNGSLDENRARLVAEIIQTPMKDRDTQGDRIVALYESAARSRNVGHRLGTQTDAWKKALRLVLATVIVAFVKPGEEQRVEDSTPFQPICRAVSKIEQWMMRKVQVLKEWRFLQEDKATIPQLFEVFGNDAGRLKELCELKGVSFKSDMRCTVAELHAVLTMESSSRQLEVLTDPHEEIAQEIIKKAEYALADSSSTCYMDIISTPPYSPNEASTAFDFFTSNVPMSDILLAESCLSRAHKSGLDGFELLQDIQRLSLEKNSVSVAVGGLGRTWNAHAFSKPRFALLRVDPRPARNSTWGTEVCHTVRTQQCQDVVRLASAIDLLAGYMQFRAEFRPSDLTDFMSATADFILDVETSPRSLQSWTKELLWTAFRFGVETMISEGDHLNAFTTLHEMVGRLHSVPQSQTSSTRPPRSNSLFRLMKIISAQMHVFRLTPNCTQAMTELCVALLRSSAGSLPTAVDVACVRILVTVSRTPNRDSTGSLLFGDVKFAKQLLERIGAFQSRVNLAHDDNETKLKDCCVVVLDRQSARPRLVDAVKLISGESLDAVCLPSTLLQLDLSMDPPPVPDTADDSQNGTELVHRNVRCDGCNLSPMRGFRFKCFTCANYDLCATCYANQAMHDLDHQFVRVTNPSGTGELLEPRSKVNGAASSEGNLVGSIQWMAGVLHAQLDANGYVVVWRGSSDDCLRRVKSLSETGFMTTVMEWPDVEDLKEFFDWESVIHGALEPGSARLGRRPSSTGASTAPRKLDRSVIGQFNQKILSMRRCHDLPDPSVLLSEMISLMRRLWNQEGEYSCSEAVVTEIVKFVQGVNTQISLSSKMERKRYYRALGLTCVLGGFVEPFRPGGWVTVKDPVTSKHRVGIVKDCAVRDSIHVRWCPNDGCSDDESTARSTCSSTQLCTMAEVDLAVIPAEIAVASEFFPTIAAVLKTAHKLLKSTAEELVQDQGQFAATELAVSWLRMYMVSMEKLPALLDQGLPGNGTGNLALLLFQLAKASKSGASIDTLDETRRELWSMQQAVLSDCQFKIATRPIVSAKVGHDATCIFGPGANGQSDLTEYVFNLYAHSSRSELPRHSGRNKLLEYWEKNVIPAIEAYVAGSFKSYEMDYFFAQLREPLREGNPAAAMKIAFTLCDGHVPSGCHYPDPDTDWTALQMDDIEIGSEYVIVKGSAAGDQCDWPLEMHWTIGHAGVARAVCPSGAVLMQLWNTKNALLEHWWFQVENLAASSVESSKLECSVDTYGSVQANLVRLDLELVGVIARRCVFAMLKHSPDQFPLVTGRQATKIHFNIVDILRMAAGADLGYEADTIVGESDVAEARRMVGRNRHELMDSLRYVLTKRFAYVPPSLDDSAPEDQSAQSAVSQASKAKLSKSSKLPSAEFASLKESQSSNAPIGLCEGLSVVKYRFTLMETLAHEMKRSLESSATFLQQNAFMVASDVPPKPMIMLKAPGATCLVISFVVHPVLMDLPAGSSLEFFRDERCTDQIFGFFGDKRGLSFLPPLIVPGDQCFVRASQASYARYKFRVDPLTSDFGLALWIGDELYQRMVSVALSSFELESIVSSVLNSIADYLVSGVALLAPCIKGVACQLLTKMINFAVSRSLSNSVPLSKLSVLTRDLAVAYDHEQQAQKGLYSLPTQQLAELLATVEEVSRLRGTPTITLSTTWWPSLVRLATFTRVLTQKRDSGVSTDILARISCGRTPIEEVDEAHGALQTRDLLCERMILVQRLPRTKSLSELRSAVSRYIQHIALEECGEADDQTVLSAAEVFRCGIIARILHLPVDESGQTIGYAVVDVGRRDVIPRLLARLEKESFEFEGDQTEEDTALIEKLNGRDRNVSVDAEDGSDKSALAVNEDTMWSCGVCTLDNPAFEVECAACGSPIPQDVLNLLGRRQRAVSTRTDDAQSGRGAGLEGVTPSETAPSVGWHCEACTLVNPWTEEECAACGSERSPDLIDPTTSSPLALNQVFSPPDSPSRTSLHNLTGIGLVKIMRVAEAQAVQQVDTFLIDCLTDGRELKRELATLIQDELSSSTAEAFLQKAANRFGAEKAICTDTLRGRVVEVVNREPIKIYQWLRDCGYDLNLSLNHYTSKEAARASQAKWTYHMEIQLIALVRHICSSFGILSLLDLCPSFLVRVEDEGSLLSALEPRDLRLRFALLKVLNKAAMDALSLVNLRNYSDTNAFRARLVTIRQLLFPAVKIRFFADTQDNANVAHSNLMDANVKRPVVTLDRRHVIAHRQKHGNVSLSDPKSSLFASTMEQLSTVKPSILRAKRPTGASDPFVAFIVVFAGENVVGEGGPYRQLFNDIATELLSPGNDLFLPTPNSMMKIGEYRDRFLPNPSSSSRAMLKMYEFVGVLIGCCIRTGVRLNVRLAPIIWKMLVKQSLSMVDIEHIDFSVCESLKFLESAASGDTSDLDEVYFDSFTTAISDGTIVELKSGGLDISVTKANCKEYVRLAKAARFQECKVQVDAILGGIGTIVPAHLLQLCTWSELQQWVCGSLAVDVELLKRHTLYSSGMTPEEFPHLDMFWRVLSNFSDKNKRRFINFAWGQDTLPADDAEFDRTHTRLLIKSPPVTDAEQDSLLPRADTCFFNIELPAYSSDEVMRERLLLAITMCTSMDGDEQAGRMDLYFSTDDMDDDHME